MKEELKDKIMTKPIEENEKLEKENSLSSMNEQGEGGILDEETKNQIINDLAEKAAANGVFQIVDGAGHCRLAGHQHIGGGGETAALTDIIKDFIVFKIQIHVFRLLFVRDTEVYFSEPV